GSVTAAITSNVTPTPATSSGSGERSDTTVSRMRGARRRCGASVRSIGAHYARASTVRAMFKMTDKVGRDWGSLLRHDAQLEAARAAAAARSATLSGHCPRSVAGGRHATRAWPAARAHDHPAVAGRALHRRTRGSGRDLAGAAAPRR